MTKRRLTEAEIAFAAKRADVLSRVDASYVASAPFVFADRITVTAALSRMELFKKVQRFFTRRRRIADPRAHAQTAGSARGCATA